VDDPEQLPVGASLEKSHMDAAGLKSSLIVPLRVGGKVIGAASMCSGKGSLDRRPWDTVTVAQFQSAADVFANAIMRKQSDEEIHSLKERLEVENRYLRQEVKLEHSHKERGLSQLRGIAARIRDGKA
jgi:GAF domain-containing protein